MSGAIYRASYVRFWGVIAALYYFFLHPHILNAVYWLADHLTFSFFIGFFYGVFVIDCVVSFNLMSKVKKFAKENDLIVRVEELKSRLALDREKFKEKPSFLLSLHDTASIKRAFENNPESFSITKKIKLKAEELTENVKEKSEVITEGIKAAGTEAKARIGETLNRNDSSDVADTDLFDNSHRDITEHKNEK